ncbi:MAG TPA: hypothetical protein PLA50_12685 [Bacteroidia bacterium]|nr:hypothetical protein [Bacteroidia bacterium]
MIASAQVDSSAARMHPQPPSLPRAPFSTGRFLHLALSAAAVALSFPTAHAETDVAPQPRPRTVREATGPFGKIEYYPITLEPPATHLWQALYDERSYWSFASLDRTAALTLLATLGLPDETMALIDSEGVWKETPSGLELELTDAIVESLSPENRAAVAKWFRLNHFYFFSKHIINFEGGDYSAFEGGAVSEATLALVKRMSFHRRNVLSLMDRAYILRKIGDDQEEKERFLRATFATRSLVVRLVVEEDTDMDSVIAYWSRDGAEPEVASLLKGVRSTDGIKRVDLVQLLPPVPRRYLYGFTHMRDIGPNNTPDCFWASMQFFRPEASPRMLDPLQLSHHIKDDFELVEGEPTYGDIVCMFNGEDGSFLHSYVHIADDIVFTKNGASFARPFVLTKKADMLSVYLDETPYTFRAFRRKK